MSKLIEQKDNFELGLCSMEIGLGEFNEPVITFRTENGKYFPIAHMCTGSYDTEVVRANTGLFSHVLDMYFLLKKTLEAKKCNAKELRDLLKLIDEGEEKSQAPIIADEDNDDDEEDD